MEIYEKINSEYGNVGNFQNPILENILKNLDELGLLQYMENARYPKDPNGNSLDEYSIKKYDNLNGSGNSASALEIMIDAISRGILKGLQEGFTQNIPGVLVPIDSDGSSNIGFKSSIQENALLQKVNLSTCTNTHEAILVLAQELNLIKLGILGLGVDIPNQLPIPSNKALIK